MLHMFNANNMTQLYSALDSQWVWSMKTSTVVYALGTTSSRWTSTRLEQQAEIFASGLGISCETFAVPRIQPGLLMHKDA